jgi:hypothetical protein
MPGAFFPGIGPPNQQREKGQELGRGYQFARDGKLALAPGLFPPPLRRLLGLFVLRHT